MGLTEREVFRSREDALLDEMGRLHNVITEVKLVCEEYLMKGKGNRCAEDVLFVLKHEWNHSQGETNGSEGSSTYAGFAGPV